MSGVLPYNCPVSDRDRLPRRIGGRIPVYVESDHRQVGYCELREDAETSVVWGRFFIPECVMIECHGKAIAVEVRSKTVVGVLLGVEAP